MNELLNEDQRERRGRHVVDLICSSRGMASIRLVAALLVASPLAAASAVASSGAPPARDQSRPRDASPPTLQSVRALHGTVTACHEVCFINRAAAAYNQCSACADDKIRSLPQASCATRSLRRVCSRTAARAGSCVAGGGFDGECAVTYSGYDAALA